MQKKITVTEKEIFNCRICHEQSLPLMKVCQCLGSISFVHKSCIKKWIGYLYKNKNIQTHPSCELCSSPLSAQIFYKEPKINNILLISHILYLPSRQKLLFLFLILFLGAMIIVDLKIIVFLVDIFVYQDWKINIFQLGTKILVIVLMKVLIPMYFYQRSIQLLNKISKVVAKSKLPILRIKIIPKIIIREQEQ